MNNFIHCSRRRFLKMSGAISSLLAVPALVREPFRAVAAEAGPAKRPGKIPIGLELYSVRAELARDLPNTLQTVGKMGYETVEFYAPYFGWSIPYAKEVRTILEDNGLRCLSTHNHIESFNPGASMAKAIELNQILGCRHVILSSAPGGTRGLEGWKNLCDKLTAAVGLLTPHGLSAGFHNHQTEWALMDGQRVMDVVAANTPKEFVLQLDVGTCMEAGADPVAWIKANPGRIKSVHLKDWAPGSAEKGYRVLFGEGITPWKELLAAVESIGGVENYLMEQEGSRYPEFETARRCLDSWKTMRSA